MNGIIKNRISNIFILCERCKVEKLWIFGSAVTSEFNKSSDFDFLVAFRKMDLVEYSESYFLLAENLEEILGRNVDLVTVNSLSNPYFIENVEKTKVLIYDYQSQKVPA